MLFVKKLLCVCVQASVGKSLLCVKLLCAKAFCPQRLLCGRSFCDSQRFLTYRRPEMSWPVLRWVRKVELVKILQPLAEGSQIYVFMLSFSFRFWDHFSCLYSGWLSNMFISWSGFWNCVSCSSCPGVALFCLVFVSCLCLQLHSKRFFRTEYRDIFPRHFCWGAKQILLRNKIHALKPHENPNENLNEILFWQRTKHDNLIEKGSENKNKHLKLWFPILGCTRKVEGWGVLRWDENSSEEPDDTWEELRWDELRWGEKSSDEMRWRVDCKVWSAKSALWSVKCGASSATCGIAHRFRTKHARTGLEGARCPQFYRWKRS